VPTFASVVLIVVARALIDTTAPQGNQSGHERVLYQVLTRFIPHQLEESFAVGHSRLPIFLISAETASGMSVGTRDHISSFFSWLMPAR
jgi:hypothetical protein